MNEQIYLNWSRIQGFVDELGPLATKLDIIYGELADYAADLHDLMLKDSDSETLSEAFSKYEELLKLLKSRAGA